MLIKRIFLISLVLAFLWITPSASAHFLATDHTIGVVLHTDPDDNAVAGSPTVLLFDVKDTTGKFTPGACDCVVKLYEGSTLLTTQSLFQNTSSNFTGSFTYAFPKKDIYKVVFTGRPSTPNAFQPFTLSWDLPIEKAGNTPQETPSWLRTHLPHIIGIGIILVFFIVLVVSDVKKRVGKRGEKTEV